MREGDAPFPPTPSLLSQPGLTLTIWLTHAKQGAPRHPMPHHTKHRPSPHSLHSSTTLSLSLLHWPSLDSSPSLPSWCCLYPLSLGPASPFSPLLGPATRPFHIWLSLLFRSCSVPDHLLWPSSHSFPGLSSLPAPRRPFPSLPVVPSIFLFPSFPYPLPALPHTLPAPATPP